MTDHETEIPTADGDDAVTLEGRLRRLEEIMGQLEADEVDVEKALALFEEGVGHVRAAEQILSETELRVEELLSSGKLEPLAEEDAG
ncbi:MAG: exodeoxyribonuclease VII small subunit [Gemmatimonadetes bacterium]|nr:exodeoxyribonuclease VII small subunit [Gemmatimonadota bacterium]